MPVSWQRHTTNISITNLRPCMTDKRIAWVAEQLCIFRGSWEQNGGRKASAVLLLTHGYADTCEVKRPSATNKHVIIYKILILLLVTCRQLTIFMVQEVHFWYGMEMEDIIETHCLPNRQSRINSAHHIVHKKQLNKHCSHHSLKLKKNIYYGKMRYRSYSLKCNESQISCDCDIFAPTVQTIK